MLTQRDDIYSSHVAAIAWDSLTQQLHVSWHNGSSTTYEGVPAAVAHEVMGGHTPSMGEALHRLVKGRYDFITKRGAPDGREGGASR